MTDTSLVGIYEIAELANVSPSAVANWRKRFPDFPAPLAELKSGPVFGESQVKLWLARRAAGDSPEIEQLYYDHLASKRGDSPELRDKIEETVDKLQLEITSTKRPGIMLGRVQSGKTRAYLGVIARAFDKGFDVAVILTKGTKSLAEQTLSRVKEDFKEFIDSDQVLVFDILYVPELAPFQLKSKLVFVVKKEDDNMKRLISIFKTQYPILRDKKVIIIDDEADLASISGRRINGVNIAGVISRQIDELRDCVTQSAFLQVTATPYALYLQPEDEIIQNGTVLFKPKRPAFTVLLPTHTKYVGGDDYFDRSTDTESSAQYFYREVPIQERDALKHEDGRRLQISRVLTEKNTAVLKDAIVTFLVGGTIRRLQQRLAGLRQQKYSFLFHTEQSRDSHIWQMRIAKAINEALKNQAQEDSPLFNELLRSAYDDLRRSVQLEGLTMPSFEDVKKGVLELLLTGQLIITKVNSDTEIKNLLDDKGQLKLSAPFNMFIGGQILDRGITINNLIVFYYGRNPNRFQQDTVLQHSRMYGARLAADLSVTRFYAPDHVYQIMKRIHEFDGALREAFESGAHDKGVYFIQRDPSRRLISCSPNKVLFSDLVSIRPGRRLVLSGFQTVSKSSGSKNLAKLDSQIASLVGASEEPRLIDVKTAINLLELAFTNLEFSSESIDDDRQAHIVALEHLSVTCKIPSLKGKVWLIAARDRKVSRYREEGRFSNAPDTKQQKDLALKTADKIPVLMMLRQQGTEEQQWRGLPFWWPVILTPKSSATIIFAMNEAILPSEACSDVHPRSLSTEELA